MIESKLENYILKITVDRNPEKHGKLPQASVVLSEDNQISLLEATHISGDYTEVMIEVFDGGKTDTIILPSHISIELISFLKSGRPPKYNCVDFINQLFNKWCKLNEYDSGLWSNNPIVSEQELCVGDAIMMTENIDFTKPLHFALYIGLGLYMSLWTSSPIIVSGLEVMQQTYRSKYYCRIIPKAFKVEEYLPLIEEVEC